jgi:hypothetical protein
VDSANHRTGWVTILLITFAVILLSATVAFIPFLTCPDGFHQKKGSWTPRATVESIEPNLRKLFGTGDVAEKDYDHDKSLKDRVNAWQNFFRSEVASPVFEGGRIRWAAYDPSLWRRGAGDSMFFTGRVAEILDKSK